MRLADRYTTEGTAKNFLLRFAEQNWISKTAAETQSLEIRLVCDSKDVVGFLVCRCKYCLLSATLPASDF